MFLQIVLNAQSLEFTSDLVRYYIIIIKHHFDFEMLFKSPSIYFSLLNFNIVIF